MAGLTRRPRWGTSARVRIPAGHRTAVVSVCFLDYFYRAGRCAAATAAAQRGRLAILARCNHDRLRRGVLHVIDRVQGRLVDLVYCISDRFVNAAIEISLGREVAAI